MRYFLTLSYNGGPFNGWQRQTNANSVQENIENALSVLLRGPVEIVGCGRTDTGVHARHYVAHFDYEGDLPDNFPKSMNAILPPEIAIQSVHQVNDSAHARYDAYERSYVYIISLRKDPFGQGLVWYYPQARSLEIEQLQAAANLLMNYGDFAPFCKAHSGVNHYRCTMKEALWVWDERNERLIFHVSANRFLRGMVRLIVGACISVANGKMTLAELKKSMDQQTPLSRMVSVPACGLYLAAIKYPEADALKGE